MGNMRIITEHDIRRLIGPAEAETEVRLAYAALARNEATLPDVLFLDIPQHHGEVHVKGAYLHGAPFFAIKAASGFYGNPSRGLPVATGAVWVFDATTGFLVALLLDGGYLTELRTGAAGAVAADLLAPSRVEIVGILGCGGQARYQLAALLNVRRPERVVVFCPTPAHANAFCEEMATRYDLRVDAASTPRAVVEAADLLITTTPSRTPIVEADWLAPGLHITAIGSDLPDKQELAVGVLAHADKVVCDRVEQCIAQGELHHAVAAGLLAREDVHAELGEIVIGAKPGREGAREITVCDLTGLGLLDAAVAGFVTERALAEGAGLTIED
jgi:ornithine cyclodeaminase/alanine dehydrogenase-like protein (mu-crystallin family)